ncbi:MAG TPA: glutamate--tRNA ligase [Candidatus Avacidaminococcus intestinavium]|uniref:Glutamate--tRNA ligase n=1 Tax=Candidatus Avacidaminococcus intestinavium TaxID=2840684 RepID=A0A9D1MQX1_9FIRM|nr:glutamate--tRNA ligase [Candidatus Avacidaminococcus intestinavium]
MSEVRVRFAPSPTGYLHIGGARTALFNWLFAKSHAGKLVLRIEDTDTERLKEDSVTQILQSLKWLGLAWDEGPEVGGNYGPYFQSERKELYRKEIDRLLAEGKAYYCFCTPEELAEEREKQRLNKQPFRYGRTCRDRSSDEVAKLLAEGHPYSVRIKIPISGKITVHDMIHGDVTFDLEQFDDFVIMKSNGMPTYNFAVVVDDHSMKISHVLRAEEHLSNTPKQIMLYEACGYELPSFGHMPMILAPDRSKLSKRHGATSVEEFREQGYLPEAIVNYLTLLGWAPGNDKEIFTLDETCQEFDFSKMSKKAAVYDTKKLTWLNGQYLSLLPAEKVAVAAKPFFLHAGLIDEDWLQQNNDYFLQLIDVVRVRVKTLTEIVDASDYFFHEVTVYEEKGINKYFKDNASSLLEQCVAAISQLSVFSIEELEAVYNNIASENGLALGKLIHPSRLALTGRTVSPGLFDVMILLGKDKVIARMNQAIDYINLL